MPTFDLPVRYNRFYPGDAPLGATAKTVTLNTEETALLLIDLYHAAEKPEAKELVNTTWDAAWWRIINDNMAPLIACARQLGLPVVYTTNSSPRIGMGRSAFGIRLRESLGFDPEVDFREITTDPIGFRCRFCGLWFRRKLRRGQMTTTSASTPIAGSSRHGWIVCCATWA